MSMSTNQEPAWEEASCKAEEEAFWQKEEKQSGRIL